MASVADENTLRYCDQLALETKIHVLIRLRVADASPLSVQTPRLFPMLCPDLKEDKLSVLAT